MTTDSTILITGASSGIGYQSVLNMIRSGLNVIAPCRNQIRAEETLDNFKRDLSMKNEINDQLRLPILDLSSLMQIKSFIRELIREGSPIDTLILNAGLQYTGAKQARWSSDGFELTFAVNHLSHQALTEGLIPLLIKSNSPRVIITSSEVHNPKSPGGKVGKKAGLGNLSGLYNGAGFEMIDGNIFSADKAYKDSKLCNILFARELSKHLSSMNIQMPIIAWAPGLIIPKHKNGFFRYSRQYNELGQRLFSLVARDILRITETPENAGKILSDLVLEPKMNNLSFIYMSNKIISPGQKIFEETEISEEANNNEIAKKLWKISKGLIEDFFSTDKQ